MLAMPFASARPVEYDSYVPNSLQLDQHTLSDGPYQISSYIAGKSITLVKNPAWSQSTDSLRHDYVDQIDMTINGSSAETQLADVQAGTEDLTKRHGVNPSTIQSPGRVKDPNFHIWPWSTTVPVHRLQPAQPEHRRRDRQAARPAGDQDRPGQDRGAEGRGRP